MSNKEPKFVVLKLRVSIPLTDKMEESKNLTPLETPEFEKKENLTYEQRVRKNAITLLGRDTDAPWKIAQKELDALMIFPDSYDVLAHEFFEEAEIGSFDITLVVHPEDRDKWVDTTQIKRVANN